MRRGLGLGLALALGVGGGAVASGGERVDLVPVCAVAHHAPSSSLSSEKSSWLDTLNFI